MKEYLKKGPLYFLVCAFFSFLSIVIQNVVSTYFPGERVIKWIIEHSILIITFLSLLLICLCIKILKLSKLRKNNKRSADQGGEKFVNRIQCLLNEVMNNDEHVESIQAFQYVIKNDSKYKFIKLNYLAGIASERIEINTILQTYFYFDKSIYRKVLNLSTL